MNSFESFLVFWGRHGTKVLGSVSTFLSGIQAAMLVMDDIFTKREVAIVSGISVAFGAWTVKRGYSNTAAADEAGAQQPSAPPVQP
jgi:hypothetical protein